MVPLVDRNPDALPPEAFEGYVWLELDGQVQSVWKKHLEIRDEGSS